MTKKLRRVEADTVVGLPSDDLDIAPAFRGRLAQRVSGNWGFNVSTWVQVRMLDDGMVVHVWSDVLVEVFDETVEEV